MDQDIKPAKKDILEELGSPNYSFTQLLIGYFRVLMTPSIWTRIYPTDNEWDAQCRRILRAKLHTIESDGQYHTTINGIRMWTSNHPYASFSPALNPYGTRATILPRRITVLFLQDLCNQYKKEHSNIDISSTGTRLTGPK